MTGRRVADSRVLCMLGLVVVVVVVPWVAPPVDAGGAAVAEFVWHDVLVPLWSFLASAI